MAAVTLRGVSRTYPGGVTAVRRVDLEVADGELVVVVGPSGCGKTTLLRLVAGLEDLSEGEIFLGGKPASRLPPKDRDIAMVFQDDALYPHLTVERNLAFGLELRRGDWVSPLWQRSGAGERVQQAAERLGLNHLLARRPDELSGGERQRVALGRALVRQPAVFLLDEPLSDLDAQTRGQMRRELKRLHRELGTTMVYVTHDQVEALSLGDRIAVMCGGEIRQAGPPLVVYDRPQDLFVAGFLGAPPMNLIPGAVQCNEGLCAFVADRFRWKPSPDQPIYRELAGKEITLGIRPEDVRLTDGPNGIPATVESVEPLGDATLLDLRCSGKVTITAKVAGRAAAQAGSQVGVEFDANRAHWFDTATERRLA